MNKNIQQLILVLLPWIGFQAQAQQVSNPVQNIPTNDSPTVFPAVPYPGLINMIGIGSFNLVRTIIPDQPLQSLPAGGSGYKHRQTTAYYDGLGRILQTIEKKAHSPEFDIVQHHVYDILGRERYSYLPFAAPVLPLTQSGGIRMDASTKFQQFYNQNGQDEPPYSRTDYDDADENKPIKQLAPGRSWVGANRGVNQYYSFNLAGEVRQWSIGNSENEVPTSPGTYEAGTLYVTSSIDEDGKEVREYKDKNGLLILRKVRLVSGQINMLMHVYFACTYYVYDNQQRLRYVIPPQAVNTIDGSWSLGSVSELCFSNSYDTRGRLIQRKIPGKAAEEFVYDQRDRLVFSRDGNLKSKDQWAFTYYDALNRPVVTGISRELPGVSRQSLAFELDYRYPYPVGHLYYYMMHYDLMNINPPGNAYTDFLTYTYYDDYSQLPGSLAYDASQLNGYIPSPAPAEVAVPVKTNVTRGMVTGSKVRVMDPESSTEQWQYTANYYDNKGRLLQSQSTDLYGGIHSISNIYTFQGQVWKSNEYYRNNSLKAVPGAQDGAITTYTIKKTYTRNLGTGGNDKVAKTEQQINNGPIFNLANYSYDHLGRVTLKDLRAGLVLQEYNIHGVLTHIAAEDHTSSPFRSIFDERLRYDWGFQSKLYNGNIAGIRWSNSDGKQHAYGYSYDQQDRLTHAEYRQQSGSAWSNSSIDYTAANISYDRNGNLLHMDQMGGDYPTGSPKKIDQLTYYYQANSNKLDQVEDAGVEVAGLPDFRNKANHSGEYSYDANGNLVKDDNKKITSITYTYLNKPDAIVTDSGTLYYVYDATGNLLQKRIKQNGTQIKYDYVGNFVIKDSVLQYIQNEEGRARPIANDSTGHNTRFVYDYFIKDHLGNVRSTITANPITASYLARHEIATANLEQLVFDNIPTVRDAKPGSTDPDDGMAAHLIASDAGKRIGTAIMLKVMPGDKFSISANTYHDGDYLDKEETGSGPVIESLMNALMGGGTYAGVPVSELPDNIKTIQTIFARPDLASQVATLQMQNNNPDAPKAHLNYLFFNDQLELQPNLSGSIQVQVNTGGGWQSTGNQNLCNCIIDGFTSVPSAPGYVVIYIDNQSIGKDVWFDNIHVEHYTSSVLEEDHYYPFGLTVGITQVGQGNLPKQPYKYQGIELERHFGLEMYETFYRGLDPQLGRFMQVDPKAEKHYDFSPYVSMGDNPVKFVDPDGDDWWATTKFAIAHPIVASDIGSVSPGSTNISTNVARFSTRGASAAANGPVLEMSREREGDEVNAFRHVLWQATITSKYGADIANEVGRAHEENPTAIDDVSQGKLSIISFNNLAEADESIDLANNITGREIGAANSGSEMKDLAGAVLNSFKEKGFWTAEKQNDGTFRMVNTKITDDQFKSLQSVFNNLDNNGQTAKERQDANIAAQGAARR